MRRPTTLERDAAMRVLRLAEHTPDTLSQVERENLRRVALAGVMAECLPPEALQTAQAVIRRCGCGDALAPAAPLARPRPPLRHRIEALWRPALFAAGLSAVAASAAYVLTPGFHAVQVPQPPAAAGDTPPAGTGRLAPQLVVGHRAAAPADERR